MASLSETECQSCEDHAGHGQGEQEDAVQEHRGTAGILKNKQNASGKIELRKRKTLFFKLYFLLLTPLSYIFQKRARY